MRVILDLKVLTKSSNHDEAVSYEKSLLKEILDKKSMDSFHRLSEIPEAVESDKSIH